MITRIIFKLLCFSVILLSSTAVEGSCIVEPTSAQMNIVSWNIQMLPNSMSIFSKSLRKKQRVRQPWIVEHCLSHDYDVIVFQEVFDAEIKRRLMRQLRQTYPYQVKPIKGDGRLFSNGILIVSRHPMKYLDHIIFDRGMHSDGSAAKGCTLVEIEADGVKLQIAGTHLQAGGGEAEQSLRNEQYADIRKLIDRNSSDRNPVFVAGDMNTRKADTSSYSHMLESIDVEDYDWQDAPAYTIDSTNYWNNHDKPLLLDYVLLQPRNTQTEMIRQSILRPTHAYEGFQMDLADHYGVLVEAVVHN